MQHVELEYHPLNNALTAFVDAEIQDPHGVAPDTVIDPNTPFQVYVKVSLRGSLVASLAGDLYVKVGIESIGPGSETELGPQSVALNAHGNGDYVFTFPVAAGQLTAGARPGRAYIATVDVGLYDGLGHLGPVHGYCRGLSFFVSAA